jgi:hypothetical protein
MASWLGYKVKKVSHNGRVVRSKYFSGLRLSNLIWLVFWLSLKIWTPSQTNEIGLFIQSKSTSLSQSLANFSCGQFDKMFAVYFRCLFWCLKHSRSYCLIGSLGNWERSKFPMCASKRFKGKMSSDSLNGSQGGYSAPVRWLKFISDGWIIFEVPEISSRLLKWVFDSLKKIPVDCFKITQCWVGPWYEFESTEVSPEQLEWVRRKLKDEGSSCFRCFWCFRGDWGWSQEFEVNQKLLRRA